MKRSWMVIIMVGAVLSSGCASVIGAPLRPAGGRFGQASGFGGAGSGTQTEFAGVGSGAGEAMVYRKGAVSTIDGKHYHSLADPDTWRPSPASLAWNVRQPTWLGPDESPLFENGLFAWGVKGLPGAEIRRLGLIGYAKTWAERGLGRSVAEISHNPSTVYTYTRIKIFPGGESRLVLH